MNPSYIGPSVRVVVPVFLPPRGNHHLSGSLLTRGGLRRRSDRCGGRPRRRARGCIGRDGMPRQEPPGASCGPAAGVSRPPRLMGAVDAKSHHSGSCALCRPSQLVPGPSWCPARPRCSPTALVYPPQEPENERIIAMLKLNVGLSRKIGEADSSSCGASANLEVELDPNPINQPDRLREHVRRLFRLARSARAGTEST